MGALYWRVAWLGQDLMGRATEKKVEPSYLATADAVALSLLGPKARCCNGIYYDPEDPGRVIRVRRECV